MLINPEVRNMLLLIPIQAVVDYVIEIVVNSSSAPFETNGMN
jgi:hypothetical protein